MPMTCRTLLIAVNAAPKLSRPAVYRLAEELARWQDADAPPDLLAQEIGVPRVQMERAFAVRRGAEQAADREQARAAALGARLVVRDDPDYPEPLTVLALPPPVLYVAGEVPAGPAVAVVGSRRSDPYGNEAAALFAGSLAAAGVTIVSGFARGIDTAAHQAALAAPGGKTVAVLGCGLAVDYPVGQSALKDEIARRGAVLSELATGVVPRPWHFPIRNRVIAALSAGVLVVQAAPRSGSLITAHHAADLGREVWAVPGRIFDERSLGSHALIRDGAALVEHPRDILDAIDPSGRHRSPAGGPPAADLPQPPPGLAADLHAALEPGRFEVAEDLAGRLAVSVDRVLGALLELEVGGWIRRMPGPVYGR